MELVFLERSIVFLPVFEELGALPVEHPIVPRPFILFMASLSEECPNSALHSVSELALIPAAVCPPESAPPVSLSFHEFAFVQV